MFPAVNPSINRETYNQPAEFASASTRNPMTLPAWLTSSSGRRPYRSLRAPSPGAASSWQNE